MSRRRSRVQRSLVAAELALCFVLLIGAGLLARSLTLLTAVEPGFRPDNLLVVKVGLSLNRYEDTLRLREFYRASLERIASIPGVERVSATSGAPFDGSSSSTSLRIEGRTTPPGGQLPEAQYRIAMPGYFETVGVPLLTGRTFEPTDRTGSPPVMVVNDALARQSWPNEPAVGKRIRFEDAWHTVVGVVGDVRNAGLDADPQPMFYVSALQWETIGQRFVVRTRTDADAFAPLVRRTITAIDPEVPVTAVDRMPALISRSVAEPRYRTVLIAVFAGIAGVLAVIGVYGVTSRAVAQQTREIGIRIALGSSDRAVVRLFLVRTMVGVVAGTAVGTVAALAAARVLGPYLYRVAPTDPLTYAAVLIPLVLVSAAASWIPARGAARTNPATVLRQ